jgi:predicted dehydrogenase
MTVDIGVFGCGKIAEKHFNAYEKIDGVNIVATDIDPEKRSVVEGRDIEWCPDPEILFDDVDAVDICTPVSTHGELIFDALAADKDIFCEKPLAENADEARAIQQEATQSEGSLIVGYLYRYHPAFEFAQSVLAKDIIGDPYYAIFRVGGRGSASTWKHKKSTGGGAGNEMLVHMLDLISWQFGPVETIRNAQSDIILNQREIDGETVNATAEDAVLLQMKTESNVQIVCQSDLITPSYMNYVEIHGTNGTLWTTILDHFPSFVYCKEPRGIFDRGHNFREFDRVDLFKKELSHFVDCVHNDTDPNWDSVSDSVQIHRIIDEALD